MEDTELLSIIEAYRDNSLGQEDGDLSNERATALDHYHGRPYGDEQDGRSQVVSKDLSETVDWVVPSLMRIFLQSGNIAEFTPVGPEDEEQARQESDYINHVMLKKNNGFLYLHDWFKDALLLKNGYVKHWWDETEKVKEAEYEGLTEIQLIQLLQEWEQDGFEAEIVEQEEQLVPGEMGLMALYDIKLKATKKRGKVKIEAVPVEEIRVDKSCRGSLQEAKFVEHITTKTRTELIEMGMDADFVDELAAANEDDNDNVVNSRDSISDESDEYVGTSVDRSMNEIEYCEAYLLVDYDGDGRAERRKVITVGNRIPPGDEWNEVVDCVPLTSIVPKRVPHRHVGESLDDELQDLQKIKTVLFRQMLDNAYLTNNPEIIVNERANLKDFLQRLPGGIKRMSGEESVSGAAAPVPIQPILQQILPTIDYVDGVKENRTGISKSSTQVDPDLLKQTTKGAYMESLNKASQKVEMIARMFAETGVKELVQRVHELTIKHQDVAEYVKLRGKFVQVDPSEWHDRDDMTVNVGLGTGNEEEKMRKLSMLADGVERVAQLGLVGPNEGFNLFTDLARTLGYDAPERYVMDPNGQQFQQMMAQQQQGEQQGNPLAEQEMVKGQFGMQQAQMKAQVDMQIAQMKEQHKHQMDMMRMQMEREKEDADRRSNEAIEAMKAEIKAMVEGFKVDVGKPGIGAGVQE